LNLIFKNETIEVDQNQPIDFKKFDQNIESFIYSYIRLFDDQTNQSKKKDVDLK